MFALMIWSDPNSQPPPPPAPPAGPVTAAAPRAPAAAPPAPETCCTYGPHDRVPLADGDPEC